MLQLVRLKTACRLQLVKQWASSGQLVRLYCAGYNWPGYTVYDDTAGQAILCRQNTAGQAILCRIQLARLYCVG